jgi:murein L,D-transpeptidase YcbB/YkuD
LFKNDYRALSSGCVRLGEPKKLLTYLSPKEDIITKDTQEEKRVDLVKRPPILIRYMTVGVDASQNIFFYDDIYGYDDLLLQTIKKINFAKCDLTH